MHQEYLWQVEVMVMVKVTVILKVTVINVMTHNHTSTASGMFRIYSHHQFPSRSPPDHRLPRLINTRHSLG
jgi:hypothetical protein